MRAQRKLVSFIGLGSHNAAALLYSYIKLHPKVCLPEKALEFFSDTKVYSQGIIWYENQFKNYVADTVCGDLASSYLSSQAAVSLIPRTYPSAKLLAVIENPLLSVRTAYVEARHARLISPQVSLAMFLKQNPEVLARARYGRQLGEYFSFYSPNDLLVIVNSELKADTLATLARVYEHIGVDKSFVPLILRHLIPDEEGESVKRPGIIKRIFRGIKMLIKNSFLFIAKKMNPPAQSVEAASITASKLNLSPELKAYLLNYYRQDVFMLSHLLHRNLNVEWGFEVE